MREFLRKELNELLLYAANCFGSVANSLASRPIVVPGWRGCDYTPSQFTHLANDKLSQGRIRKALCPAVSDGTSKVTVTDVDVHPEWARS